MNSALVTPAMILASVVLPVPGGPPEDHRTGVVALDLHAQRLAGADQVFLADEFFQGARTHAVGQRTRARADVLRARDGLEQAHTIISPQSHRDTEKTCFFGQCLRFKYL